jgi:hypothetical protein
MATPLPDSEHLLAMLAARMTSAFMVLEFVGRVTAIVDGRIVFPDRLPPH